MPLTERGARVMKSRVKRLVRISPLVLVALAFAACAEGSRSDADAGGLLPPLDAGRSRDAGASTDDAASLDDASTEDATTGDATTSDASTLDSGNDAAAVTPPVADGTIAAGEYGEHTDGKNQRTSDVDAATPTTFYMTWDASNVYVGVAYADVSEGVVLYFELSPLSPSNGGTNVDGSLVGQTYDGAKLATLPFRADAVVYAKSSYNEVRLADGAGGFGGPTAGAVSEVGTGNVRELVIPWSTIHTGGRPASFSWLGYATSASGYVYGEMPPANPGGAIGTAASFTHFYSVPDAAPVTGSKPFALDATP